MKLWITCDYNKVVTLWNEEPIFIGGIFISGQKQPYLHLRSSMNRSKFKELYGQESPTPGQCILVELTLNLIYSKGFVYSEIETPKKRSN